MEDRRTLEGEEGSVVKDVQWAAMNSGGGRARREWGEGERGSYDGRHELGR